MGRLSLLRSIRPSITATRCSLLMQALLGAILKAMRHWPPGEFLSAATIVERIAEDQGSQPSSLYHPVRGLLNKQYAGYLFVSRGTAMNKEYAILEDLPCQKCGKQDDYDNMILCSRCSTGWHLKCLPAKHRLKTIPEKDWDCPKCIRQGHQDDGNGPPKVRGATGNAEDG